MNFEVEKLKQIANLLPPDIYPPDQFAPREVRDAQKALIDSVSVARDYLSTRGISWFPWEQKAQASGQEPSASE